MKMYRIKNSVSGETLGDYRGESSEDAFQSFFKDPGADWGDLVADDLVAHEIRSFDDVEDLYNYITGEYVRPMTAEESDLYGRMYAELSPSEKHQGVVVGEPFGCEFPVYAF